MYSVDTFTYLLKIKSKFRFKCNFWHFGLVAAYQGVAHNME